MADLYLPEILSWTPGDIAERPEPWPRAQARLAERGYSATASVVGSSWRVEARDSCDPDGRPQLVWVDRLEDLEYVLG